MYKIEDMEGEDIVGKFYESKMSLVCRKKALV